MQSSSADIDGESKTSTPAFEGIDAVTSRASINLETSESDASRVEIQQPASNSRFAEKSKELERAAQIMFYVGCCLLPWVWCLSIIYFWKIYNSETCPAGVKMYIKQSIHGLILVTLLFSVWVVVFQTNKLSSWAHPLLIVPQNDGW